MTTAHALVVTTTVGDLAPAMVTVRSYLEHNAPTSATVIVVDADVASLPSPDGVRFAALEEIGFSSGDAATLGLALDPVDLARAVRPAAMRWVLDDGAPLVVALGPGQLWTAAFALVERISLDVGLVVLSRRSTPVPPDGFSPSPVDLVRHGVANPDVLIAGAGAGAALDWLASACTSLRDDEAGNPLGLSRLLEQVAAITGITPAPGASGIATIWNLDEASLSGSPMAPQWGSAPLACLDCNHVDGGRPWLFDAGAPERGRVLISETDTLGPLIARYIEAVANEAKTFDTLPESRFTHLATTVQLTPAVRAVYRAALRDANPLEPVPPVPFCGDDEAVMTWFCQPVEPDGQLTRVLAGIWSNRDDLRAHFPDVFGRDEGAMLSWARHGGVAEGAIPDAFAPSEEAIMRAGSPRRDLTLVDDDGVNIVGFFRAELGVGEIARAIATAAQRGGIATSLWNWSVTNSRQDAAFAVEDTSVRHPITISVLNADRLPIWAGGAGRGLFGDTFHIGVWAWEVEVFPQRFASAFDLVDEVWALSRFNRDAIAAQTDKEVSVLPMMISEPEPTTRPQCAGDGPYVLFCFDYFSSIERKNPFGVIDAFCMAFGEGSGPRLIIKTINADRARGDRERLRAAIRGRRDIVVIDSYLSKEELDGLMAHASAYISLHRAEGLGLTMAEAMSHGVPVIATAYSGNLDFMDDTVAALVPVEMVPVPHGAGPYPTSAVWAAPDTTVAAAHLRWVFDEPESAAALGERGRAHILDVAAPRHLEHFVTSRIAHTRAIQTYVPPPPTKEEKLAERVDEYRQAWPGAKAAGFFHLVVADVSRAVAKLRRKLGG